MTAPVGDIVELVGPDRSVRLALRQSLREATGITDVIVGVGIGRGGHFYEFGADQLEQVLLFLALRVGNHDHGAEAHRGGDHAEADAGIAGGAFHDGPAGTQRAARDGVADDGERGAVLDRPAGIHEFGLAENPAARGLRRRAELDQRRVSDGLDDTGLDIHDDLCGLRCCMTLGATPMASHTSRNVVG